jgi:putative transcriptional regulator
LTGGRQLSGRFKTRFDDIGVLLWMGVNFRVDGMRRREPIKIVPPAAWGYNVAMPEFNLTHHFLIAMPAMQEGVFAGTLTYICEHNENGALGIVVNRPISLTLGEMFNQVNIALDQPDMVKMPVYFGGPVQTERGFVLHDTPGNWESTLLINNKLALTTSKDILEAIGAGQGPRNVIVTLGYAGWDQGQLEHEITENIWLTVAASEHILFDLPPEERLPAAMALLGVEYGSLVEDAGHA